MLALLSLSAMFPPETLRVANATLRGAFATFRLRRSVMASNVETLIRSAITKGIGKVADFNRQRLPRPTDAHPYLTGIHTPMDKELTLESLALHRAIPAPLSGPIPRNGPPPAPPPQRPG